RRDLILNGDKIGHLPTELITPYLIASCHVPSSVAITSVSRPIDSTWDLMPPTCVAVVDNASTCDRIALRSWMAPLTVSTCDLIPAICAAVADRLSTWDFMAPRG